jgi:hypothetical protein
MPDTGIPQLPDLLFDDELANPAALAEDDVKAIGLGRIYPHLEVCWITFENYTEDSPADLISLPHILDFFRVHPISPSSVSSLAECGIEAISDLRAESIAFGLSSLLNCVLQFLGHPYMYQRHHLL